MKRLLFICLILIGFAAQTSAQEHRRYALIWSDEFNDGALDTKVWSKIWRHESDWAIHLTSHDSLYAFDNGDLVLRGMVNTFRPNDTAYFLTGGVWSKNKKTFGFGRVEVRAKFDVAQGFWPAIWMLPRSNQGLLWPFGGEIDIMEHFRDNPFVNQTVHSNYTYYLRKRNRPSQVAYPRYNEGEYNTYGVERFQDSLVFFVNGKRTFCYPRFRQGENGQFPFSNHEFYLILDAQLGRDRSPFIDTAKLPVELRIDYVRYYELDTKTDVIPEPKDFQQFGNRKYRLRKIEVDAESTFSHPDEYRLVVKNGKAIISGNRHWAEQTLSQLVGDNGKISNLEVHDVATCAVRGIVLDSIRNLTFNDLNWILETMTFYKLNALQWNGEGDFTEAEKETIRERAKELGIGLFANRADIPECDYVDTEGTAQLSAASRVFLQPASEKGGWLILKEIDAKVIMAFAERYWRGGSAGLMENADGFHPLTTAGTRLANFEERMAVHQRRYLEK